MAEYAGMLEVWFDAESQEDADARMTALRGKLYDDRDAPVILVEASRAESVE